MRIFLNISFVSSLVNFPMYLKEDREGRNIFTHASESAGASLNHHHLSMDRCRVFAPAGDLLSWAAKKEGKETAPNARPLRGPLRCSALSGRAQLTSLRAVQTRGAKPDLDGASRRPPNPALLAQATRGTQNTNTPRCSDHAIEPAIFLAALVQEPLGMLCITQRGCVQCGPGWDARRILRPIACAIGNKCIAADRPGPR